MNVINAVAEFERDLLVERTQAGLRQAKAEGKRLGRPASLTAEQRQQVIERLREGAGASALARVQDQPADHLAREGGDGSHLTTEGEL